MKLYFIVCVCALFHRISLADDDSSSLSSPDELLPYSPWINPLRIFEQLQNFMSYISNNDLQNLATNNPGCNPGTSSTTPITTNSSVNATADRSKFKTKRHQAKKSRLYFKGHNIKAKINHKKSRTNIVKKKRKTNMN